MKIDVKNLPDSEKELLIEVPFLELKPFIDEVTELSRKNLEIKGFRKGKVPAGIAKKELSQEDILAKAAEKAVKKYYLRAIREKELDVISKPAITITKLAQGNPLEFKIRVSVMPELELPDYKGIASQVGKKTVSVDEKEVEQTIKWLQRARAKTFPKQGSCEPGDFVEISYSSPLIDDGKENKEKIVIGQSHLLPDFEKNIVGMIKGQEKEFTITFPRNYINKELAEKEVRFKLKLLEVERVELPEINDEWVKTLGNFENLFQLRENIRQGIQKEKEAVEKQRLQAEILERIAKETSCEIPKVLIDLETEKTVDDLKQRIPQMLKMSFKEYLDKAKIDEEAFRNSLLPEVKTKIKKFLVLRELRRLENITADEKEVIEESEKFLARFQGAKEAGETIDPENLREYTKERIESQRTLEFLESLTK